MTAPRDPDAILAAWLDEGPTRLPEQTRRAIAVTTRTTEQSRRPTWAPWRTPVMASLARVAVAAIAVVALVGGAIYLVGPDQGVGITPTPQPGVTSTPSSASPATPSASPIAWTKFQSRRFAYSIDHPADWISTPATEDWPAIGFPYPDGPSVDRFRPTPTSLTWVFASSVPLAVGQVAAERFAELDGGNAQACQLSGRHDITIDRVTARQEDFYCFGKDHGIEVVVASGGRFYQIDLFSSAPIGESDRATFDRFLGSFRFGG